ncbi:MAG: hypothetical protein AAGF72_11415, partial [Pseudomonadota bacterium]
AKAIAHPERLARYTPPVVIHGVLMLAWIGVFAAQAKLIASGGMGVHRQVGRLSWILVLLMVTTSFGVSFSLMVEFRFTEVFLANLVNLALFIGFFTAALFAIAKQDGASHKRYMLFATLAILLPAFSRIAEVFAGNEYLALPMVIIATVGLPLLYDKSQSQPVHPSTIIGIAGSLAGIVLMVIAIASPLGDALLAIVA